MRIHCRLGFVALVVGLGEILDAVLTRAVPETGVCLWAGRPRSAAPSRISPSPPPRRARSSIPTKNGRLGTGGAQRMLAQRNPARTLNIGSQPYGGRPRRPVFVLFWAKTDAAEWQCTGNACGNMQAGRRRVRGDFRRCRGARATRHQLNPAPTTARVSTAAKITPNPPTTRENFSA